MGINKLTHHETPLQTKQELSQLKDSIQLTNTIDEPTQQTIQSVLKYLYKNQKVNLSFDVIDATYGKVHYGLQISHITKNSGRENQETVYSIHLSQRAGAKIIEDHIWKIAHNGRSDETTYNEVRDLLYTAYYNEKTPTTFTVTVPNGQTLVVDLNDNPIIIVLDKFNEIMKELGKEIGKYYGKYEEFTQEEERKKQEEQKKKAEEERKKQEEQKKKAEEERKKQEEQKKKAEEDFIKQSKNILSEYPKPNHQYTQNDLTTLIKEGSMVDGTEVQGYINGQDVSLVDKKIGLHKINGEDRLRYTINYKATGNTINQLTIKEGSTVLYSLTTNNGIVRILAGEQELPNDETTINIVVNTTYALLATSKYSFGDIESVLAQSLGSIDLTYTDQTHQLVDFHTPVSRTYKPTDTKTYKGKLESYQNDVKINNQGILEYNTVMYDHKGAPYNIIIKNTPTHKEQKIMNGKKEIILQIITNFDEKGAVIGYTLKSGGNSYDAKSGQIITNPDHQEYMNTVQQYWDARISQLTGQQSVLPEELLNQLHFDTLFNQFAEDINETDKKSLNDISSGGLIKHINEIQKSNPNTDGYLGYNPYPQTRYSITQVTDKDKAIFTWNKNDYTEPSSLNQDSISLTVTSEEISLSWGPKGSVQYFNFHPNLLNSYPQLQQLLESCYLFGVHVANQAFSTKFRNEKDIQKINNK